MVQVIGVGDNTVDRYLDLRTMFPGGNAVNVAVLAHRYGHPASYLGWLGDDAHGRLILDALDAEGIDTSHCRVVQGANAYNDVSLVDSDRVFGAYDHGVSADIDLTEEDLRFISQHDVTHTSIYSHLESDLERLGRASRYLSFDFADGWDRAYLSSLLPCVDLALVSYPARSRSQTEDLMRWMLARGPELVLVTQGADGAMVYDGMRAYRQGIVEAEVVDTLGAGDAFAARFLVEHLGGTPIPAALEAAAESAAETCGYYGAFGHGIPFQAHYVEVGHPNREQDAQTQTSKLSRRE
jgi:fructoselysine 6-kinase